MTVPKSAKKEIPRTCSICGEKLRSKEYLIYHIDKRHHESIPKGWSASRYENYLRTGNSCGYCTECKKETAWNESTWKYNRICTDPKCRDAIAKRAKKNMIGKYGKVHLLNDPEMQRKMIYAKRTSGKYYWSDDKDEKYPCYYASKPEKEFLEMLDVFLNMDSSDCISPSPHNYTYKYQGEDHIYIPDMYITSLNLEVEIKEPKDNQNQHPKIQAVDKVKEQLKDDVMKSIDEVNYIKINGTDYREFFILLSELKEEDICIKTKSGEVSVIQESFNIFGELNEDVSLESLTEYMSVMEKQLTSLRGYSFHTELRIAEDRVNNINDIYNPGLDYINLVDRLERAVNEYPDKELPNLSKHIDKVDNELKRLIDYAEDKKQGKYRNQQYVFEMKRARDKINDIIKPRLKYRMSRIVTESLVTPCNITATKDGVIYRPVFILLSQLNTLMGKMIKIFTGEGFSHASISLDTTLHNMCSFGTSNDMKRIGFVPDESIEYGGFVNDNAYYSLYMYMANESEYEAITNTVEWFRGGDTKASYSIRGLINYIFNKESHYSNEYFCSGFVSYILQQGNPDLLPKHYSLYSPNDLRDSHKFRKVDSGLVKDYDQKHVHNKIRRILKERGFENVRI